MKKVLADVIRPRLSSCERSSEERQEKKDKVTRQEERVVLRKIGTWIVRRRSRTKRSCMSRDKGCRSNCDISKNHVYAAGHSKQAQ